MRTIDELADEISLLAGHINAAMARWLELVAEFDEREGWAEWGCRSCAQWVSWRCSIAPGPAREHVRVARRLRELPAIRDAFAAGELSYSKVRALTRVDGVEAEEPLLALARTSTAAQLERVVQAHRGVTRESAARIHEERHLTWFHDDDGALVLKARLSPDEGAVLRKALEVMAAREGPQPRPQDVPAGTPAPPDPVTRDRELDALVLMAEQTLAAEQEPAGRSGGDRFQVLVHVDADDGPAAGGGAHLDDGPALARETVRRLCCDASLVGIRERDGAPLDVGRKTRSIPPALRRALRARDRGCRFPGCTQHRWVDAHHVEHWADGGRTAVGNLVQLCRHHHRLVHEGGFRVERDDAGGFLFRRPDGRALDVVVPPRDAPAPLGPAAVVEENERRGLAITAMSTVPDWYGDRLDLDLAVESLLIAERAV